MSHKSSYLAQFRSDILPLQIEGGMWENTNVVERLCLECEKGLVENEQYFIFHCNYYNPKIVEFWAKCVSRLHEKLHMFTLKENVQEFTKYIL